MSEYPAAALQSLTRLTAVQRRVFGVLIEKSLTTPAGYPLTLNALVAGCTNLTAGMFTCTDTSAKAGTSYSYYVVAAGSGGQSTQSNTVTVKTPRR